LVVVRGFPGAQADGRGIEVAESVAAPEFFLVDSMTAFDLAVLLGPARPDVAMTNPQRLHRQREGKGAHCSLRMRKGNARQSSARNSRLELWCSRR